MKIYKIEYQSTLNAKGEKPLNKAFSVYFSSLKKAKEEALKCDDYLTFEKIADDVIAISHKDGFDVLISKDRTYYPAFIITIEVQ